MYNALLDRLPEDYKGWLIRTDYRIGVQIQLCLSDAELCDSEQTWTALSLLYGNGMPDLETAVRGLGWFMSCGAPETAAEEDGGPEVYSFEYDAGRLASAFRRGFGLDISRERLHWFSFVSMLGDLGGTAFSGVMDIRTTEAAEVDQRKRAEFLRMKRRFALPGQYTAEETAAIADILRRVKEPEP